MIAKGSAPWICTPFILGVVALSINFIFKIQILLIPALLFFLLFTLFLLFFRDPEREIGNGIVASADGKVIGLSEEGKNIKISTFMNIHNVHVNRCPIDGKVLSVRHFDGRHLPAFRDGSEHNERVVLVLESVIGEIRIVQIAGTLARRIVPYIKENDMLRKGERIGIIRFGSRVELFLPKDRVKVKIAKGESVVAGVTTVAEVVCHENH